MSFHGTSMIFDGIACEEMGLVLYDFDSHKQEATKFSSNLSISEDRIDGRYRSLFYGGVVNEPLVFTMVLCAREDRALRNEPFDRWDTQKIASWLTGHTEYKWLSIVQPDLADVRYRCICSDLEAVEIAGNKFGFVCKVTCDSPFAYMTPRTYKFDVPKTGVNLYEIISESTHNGMYYPQIYVSGLNGGNVVICVTNEKEQSDFTLKGLPTTVNQLVIDCENGVISTPGEENIYQYIDFTEGFHFPRFARGKNFLLLSGAGSYQFKCEWPVNVGG